MMADLNEERGEAVLKELRELGYENVSFKTCNVAKATDVEALYEYTMATFNGIDSIINNAGIFIGGMLHETTEEEWNRIFDVDVKSIYLTSKYFIPYMIENGGGTIVNTASVSGMFGDYNMAAYNGAKGAVVNLAKAMALDYGKYNI